MFKPLAAIFAGLLAFTPAAQAYDPADVFETQTQQDGSCYETNNKSKLCWQRIKGQIFTVALLDTKLSQYPVTFLIDCSTGGKWEAYGVLGNGDGNKFASSFCQDAT